jgi:hypothetical protein
MPSSSVARFEVRSSWRKIVSSSIKVQQYLANEGRVAIGFCVDRFDHCVGHVLVSGCLKQLSESGLSRPLRLIPALTNHFISARLARMAVSATRGNQDHQMQILLTIGTGYDGHPPREYFAVLAIARVVSTDDCGVY